MGLRATDMNPIRAGKPFARIATVVLQVVWCLPVCLSHYLGSLLPVALTLSQLRSFFSGAGPSIYLVLRGPTQTPSVAINGVCKGWKMRCKFGLLSVTDLVVNLNDQGAKVGR